MGLEFTIQASFARGRHLLPFRSRAAGDQTSNVSSGAIIGQFWCKCILKTCCPPSELWGTHSRKYHLIGHSTLRLTLLDFWMPYGWILLCCYGISHLLCFVMLASWEFAKVLHSVMQLSPRPAWKMILMLVAIILHAVILQGTCLRQHPSVTVQNGRSFFETSLSGW